MKKMEIVDKRNYVYTFEDEEGKPYNINLDFLDIEKKPEIGEYIFFNEELLNPRYDGYSTSYTFGSLDSKYGKNNISLDDVDVIKLVMEEKEIYLKRLYG